MDGMTSNCQMINEKDGKEMSKPFHSIKIIGEPNSIHKKVILDGKELKRVRRAYVQFAVDEIPCVYLEIQTLDVEVDEQNGGILFEGESYETERREALEHNEQTVEQVQKESKN